MKLGLFSITSVTAKSHCLSHALIETLTCSICLTYFILYANAFAKNWVTLGRIYV